jgi:hypothetical protein
MGRRRVSDEATWARGRKADLKRRRQDPGRLMRWKNELRNDIFAAYGNACACCGEKLRKFLTIDHKNNDGHLERRGYIASRRRGGGIHTYAHIRKAGYPDEFQLLCWNCNCGRGQNGGICPHKEA